MMKSGLLRHPYLGDTRSCTSNNRQIVEIKMTAERNEEWFKKYLMYKNYEWKYCLFPLDVAEEPDQLINNPIPKKYPTQKITYSYHVTSLREEIRTRAKSKAKFSEGEILYITYTIAMAWRQWKQFCSKNNVQNNFFAISSRRNQVNHSHKLTVDASLSCVSGYLFIYQAPQNLPPQMETAKSWNKSIIFSLGLIGAEMITMNLAQSFYQLKGNQMKFNFEEFDKWLKLSQQNVPKEIFNLIKLMTDANPWIRLKLGQFEALLAPYHQSILEASQQRLDYQKSKQSLIQYLKKKKNSP